MWCRAMCGQNLHAECFRMWARTKRGDEVTCPMCRAPWQKDDEEEQLFRSLMSMGRIGPDGYVNVADMLGISPHRGEWNKTGICGRKMAEMLTFHRLQHVLR